MYAAIWHALPGRWPVRLLIVLTLAVGAALVLTFHVYPWVMQEWFPTPDPVLGAGALAPGSSAPVASTSVPPSSTLLPPAEDLV